MQSLARAAAHEHGCCAGQHRHRRRFGHVGTEAQIVDAEAAFVPRVARVEPADPQICARRPVNSLHRDRTDRDLTRSVAVHRRAGAVLTKTGVVKLRLVGAFVYAGESLIAVAVVLYCTWSD